MDLGERGEVTAVEISYQHPSHLPSKTHSRIEGPVPAFPMKRPVP
jgi:hypothetical protein